MRYVSAQAKIRSWASTAMRCNEKCVGLGHKANCIFVQPLHASRYGIGRGPLLVKGGLSRVNVLRTIPITLRNFHADVWALRYSAPVYPESASIGEIDSYDSKIATALKVGR